MAEEPRRELKALGIFEDRPDSPLLGFSRALVGPAMPTVDTSRSRAALAERKAASERVAQSYERGAKEGEEALADLAKTQAAQATERAGAKPAPLELQPPPRAYGRAFLEPGESMLGQIQTLIMALGQMGMQAHGLRGSAIGAVAAMKGMAEGWAAGDSERIKHQYAEWQANSDRLIAQHRATREAYLDLLNEQHRTMDEKLQGIRLRADLNGNKVLAEAARVGDIDATLKHLEHQEGLELQAVHFQAQMAHWYQQAAEHERNFLATEAHRRETEARAQEAGARNERRTKLLEETQGNMLKMQKEELGLTQKITNIGLVKEAVALLKAEGIAPSGTTFLDRTQAALTLQSKPGRTDIARAVDIVQRLGTPILIGTEISLGVTAGALRLKAIGEAEAKNAVGIPWSFWETFLPLAEKNALESRDIVREHLKGLGRLTPTTGDYEILSTSP